MSRNLKTSNWPSEGPQENQPALPTGFEEQLLKLGLNEQICEASRELRQTCIPFSSYSFGDPLDP